MPRTHELTGQSCPVCATLLDRATSADGNTTPPKVGDLTVCINCSTVLEWTLGMILQVSDKRDKAGRLDLIRTTIRKMDGGVH